MYGFIVAYIEKYALQLKVRLVRHCSCWDAQYYMI